MHVRTHLRDHFYGGDWIAREKELMGENVYLIDFVLNRSILIQNKRHLL